MYAFLLPLHSLVRWLVLILLVLSIFMAWRGWVFKRPFSRFAALVQLITLRTVHLQFCLGLLLYFLSPLVNYFLHHFRAAVHMREIRFFGMEHITMMFIAIAMITIGSDQVNRLSLSEEKYKAMTIWFGIGLLIILTSIPWSFSPLTSRPGFRFF